MSVTVLASVKPEIWETIPGARVLNIIEAFGLCEIDAAPSLPRFGIEQALKNDTPVPAQQAGAWLEYLVETFPQRGVGLQFARMHTLLDSGMVGYTILSSDTVGEALIQRIRFSPLLRPYFGMELRVVDDELAELAVLELVPAGADPDLDPPAAHLVDGRDNLHEVAGVPERHRTDEAPEPDRRRLAGETREDRPGVRRRAVGVAREVGVVVAPEEGLEPEALGQPGDRQLVVVAQALLRLDHQREAHRVLRSRGRFCGRHQLSRLE